MTAVEAGQVFRLPDLGEGLTGAEVLEWKVAVGDHVAVDQVVVEVETAKAAVEVPCPYAGQVVALHGEPGQHLAVGDPLLSVGPAGDAGETFRREERAGSTPRPAASADGSGAVLVGYGTGAGGSRRRRRRGGAAEASGAPAPGSVPLAPRVTSPVVRRLVKEHGLVLSRLTGSGPAGVVLRRDVEAAVGVLDGTESAVGASPADVRIPLRGLRRTVADKLARSRREIPDATTWVDVDATGLVEARQVLQEAYPDHRIGVLAVLARFVVAGLARHPELNSSVDTEREEIMQHGAVHLGFAAQTDRGLVVPVVRDAHQMTLVELADELARLTELARHGRLGPEHLTGGTFTLNNYGVFGVDGSTPIINHPEAALLGVGRIVDKPWVVDGALAVRKVTQLSLTFDHRVCDGGVAGGFLRYVADAVERPVTLLGAL
ncbi:MAG TPA: dihydrolipoamide acetyltransferase family protein [Jiangellales bacterium]|nr:dihydrolipoamide acetyltransferase family protein [Jiangellales bacterium]